MLTNLLKSMGLCIFALKSKTNSIMKTSKEKMAKNCWIVFLTLIVVLFIYAFWANGMKTISILDQNGLTTYQDIKVHNMQSVEVVSDTVKVDGYPVFILEKGQKIYVY